MNTSHIFKRKCALLTAALAVGSVSVQTSHAQAIISNGLIKLGVDNGGNLNIPGTIRGAGSGFTTNVGLRLITPAGEYESTADGCVCEGWGASDSLTGNRVYYNNAAGSGGGTPVSFVSTASTAVSTVQTGGQSLNNSFGTGGAGPFGGGPLTPGSMLVTHDYHPSTLTPNLYEVLVTIQNTSLAPENILYRRVMDWDIEPTAFSEFVTMQYSSLGGFLKHTSDNGFDSADASNPLSGGLQDLTFTDLGPSDHGAAFQFDFGILAPGSKLTFKTYYGAAPTEAAALAALGAVGAQAYSLGQQSGDPLGGTPATHMFAFGDIGLPTAPGLVPEPSTVIGGIALAGLAAGRMLRRKKA